MLKKNCSEGVQENQGRKMKSTREFLAMKADERVNYTQIPRQILCDPALEPVEKLLWMVLFSFQWSAATPINPSRRIVAQMMGWQWMDQVTKYYKRLEEKGYLRYILKGKGNETSEVELFYDESVPTPWNQSSEWVEESSSSFGRVEEFSSSTGRGTQLLEVEELSSSRYSNSVPPERDNKGDNKRRSSSYDLEVSRSYTKATDQERASNSDDDSASKRGKEGDTKPPKEQSPPKTQWRKKSARSATASIKLLRLLNHLGEGRPEQCIEKAVALGWSEGELEEMAMGVKNCDDEVIRSKPAFLRSLLRRREEWKEILDRYLNLSNAKERRKFEIRYWNLIAEYYSEATGEKRRQEIRQSVRKTERKLSDLGADVRKLRERVRNEFGESRKEVFSA